ncbi:MAG: RcnB family protein [Sphingopyxis sp.]|nr:RcnB family protein [Sphingopyxis sp.]
MDRRGDNNRRYDRNNNNNRYDRDRNGYNDRRYRDGRSGNNWNRDWRSDRRYDWRSYRNQNRSHYRMPRYYNPYRGYGYTRFSIGFSLNSLFYSQRYWINDPGYYRLPPAYGDTRWIRYYNDALLVDTYSGEVIDVINDFFW